MVIPMKIDADGLAQLRELELCRLVAYWDKNGWALGYGQHGPNITKGSTCTLDQAEQWLIQTTDAISSSLSKLINPQLNQGQFNVLVIFAYNVGVSGFASSHLLSGLNSGDFDCVPSQLIRWVYSNHKIDPVLETRRQTEIALWKEASKAQNKTS